ncbi:hypothetical protein ACEZDB_12020 [Streptacidiphilus sp. N1-3]|uniref:Uncharacterized protein n=1 Tax=Streptacidiphilus alkalitolerans TaxID=3342712 RepID=A0ABV6WZF9_9ACTN
MNPRPDSLTGEYFRISLPWKRTMVFADELLPLVRDIAAGRAQDGAGKLPLTAEEARAALAPLGLDGP